MGVSLIIIIVVMSVAINYCGLIILFALGLRKLARQASESNSRLVSNAIDYESKDPHNALFNPEGQSNEFKVSVIIAARNEQETIGNCLNCLSKQDYHNQLFEVIVVNDQSEDQTSEIINNYIKSGNLHLKQLLTTGKGGKKTALSLGLQHCTGKIILFTDADCEPSKGWISSMVNCFNKTNALMVAGPVVLQGDGSFFSKFQITEFDSLIASTAGSIAIEKPIMCNGANLGFTREIYKELITSRDAMTSTESLLEKVDNSMTDVFRTAYLSGDDVFLMLSIKKKYGATRIRFLNEKAGIVFTKPMVRLRDFINQRIRWTSKSGGYRDPFLIYSALSVFSLNMILLLLAFSLIMGVRLPIYLSGEVITLLPFLLVVVFSLKSLADFLLLYIYTGRFGKRRHLLLLIILEPLVIVYTSFIGIAGNVSSFEWKGR